MEIVARNGARAAPTLVYLGRVSRDAAEPRGSLWRANISEELRYGASQNAGNSADHRTVPPLERNVKASLPLVKPLPALSTHPISYT